MAEKPAPSSSGSPLSRLPGIIGGLGLYATYVSAVLFVVAIGSDLDVLALHAPLLGWLALLVGTGPLVALLLGTVASYINYYGVWRILRGKDKYEAREDLKSHANDVPQAVQEMLAGVGCLPAVSTAVLCLSLLLVLATGLPPQTPFIGNLGTWQSHLDGLVFVAARATPTPTPTAMATYTPIPTPTATPSPTPKPTPTPSPTPIPVIIKFSISPTAASWQCSQPNGLFAPPPQTVTLDNSGSNVSVRWQATAVEPVYSPTGALLGPWASLSVSSGTISAHGKQALTVSPYPPGPLTVCYNSTYAGTPWHISVVVAGVGKYTFTYTISYNAG